jgi:hypothetical protein
MKGFLLNARMLLQAIIQWCGHQFSKSLNGPTITWETSLNERRKRKKKKARNTHGSM